MSDKIEELDDIKDQPLPEVIDYDSILDAPNVSLGGYVGKANIFGSKQNTFLGEYAGQNITTGNTNVFIGSDAGKRTTTGNANIFLGYYAGFANTIGDVNVFIGYRAGQSNTINDGNVFIGYRAGQTNVTGSYNIGLGAYAGYYETGSNAFYVNNQDRTNTAGDKASSLLYGVMAASVANQKLTINALLNQSVSKTPASASATGTAGDICWDASNIYVCVATDTWKKVAIATW